MLKRFARVSLWIGAIWTGVRTVIWWIGDIQTVQQLAEDRGSIVNSLSRVLLSQWLGPSVVVVALFVYWYLEHYKSFARLSTPPAAPIQLPQASSTNVERLAMEQADAQARFHGRRLEEQKAGRQRASVVDAEGRLASGVSFTGGEWEREYQQKLLTQAADQLTIHSAIYGFRDSVSDVAGIVRNKIKDNQIDMLANNTTMGGDPCQGRDKELTVIYSIGGGQLRTAKKKEHERLRLPPQD